MRKFLQDVGTAGLVIALGCAGAIAAGDWLFGRAPAVGELTDEELAEIAAKNAKQDAQWEREAEAHEALYERYGAPSAVILAIAERLQIPTKEATP